MYIKKLIIDLDKELISKIINQINTFECIYKVINFSGVEGKPKHIFSDLDLILVVNEEKIKQSEIQRIEKYFLYIQKKFPYLILHKLWIIPKKIWKTFIEMEIYPYKKFNKAVDINKKFKTKSIHKILSSHELSTLNYMSMVHNYLFEKDIEKFNKGLRRSIRFIAFVNKNLVYLTKENNTIKIPILDHLDYFDRIIAVESLLLNNARRINNYYSFNKVENFKIHKSEYFGKILLTNSFFTRLKRLKTPILKNKQIKIIDEEIFRYFYALLNQSTLVKQRKEHTEIIKRNMFLYSWRNFIIKHNLGNMSSHHLEVFYFWNENTNL